ncbi:MAG: hypothetical protein L3K19_09325 [Thermoplasmata archaeon]|nr:hypothetical protein [Thermoplasmata archaeon]
MVRTLHRECRGPLRGWLVAAALSVAVGLSPVAPVGWTSAAPYRTHLLTIGPPAAFTPTNGRWGSVPTERAPPACGGSMTFDAADGQVILFTGGSPTLFPSPGGPCVGPSTTWSYVHGAWSEISTSPVPPSRSAAAMTYDESAGEIVLFGGSHSGRFLSDTWSYHAGNWTNLTPRLSPSARENAGMVYSPVEHAVVLFGGYGPTNRSAMVSFSDTWELQGGVWRLLTPPTSPSPRNQAATAFDQLDSEVLVFGGSAAPAGGNRSCCVPAGETWRFASGQWANLTTRTGPGPHVGAGMAYDPEASAVILFGGSVPNASVATWAFSYGLWSSPAVGSSPSPRSGADLTYDAVDGYLLLFGGSNSTVTFNDTWAFGPGVVGSTHSGDTTILWGIGGGMVLVGAAAAIMILRRPDRSTRSR